MQRPSNLVLALFCSLLIGISINVTLFVVETCSAASYAKLISDAGGSCTEYWLNRYQTFIAAIIAFTGAALTILMMRRQTERTSADAAVNSLNRYAAILRTTVSYYEECYNQEMFQKLLAAANGTEARLISADNLLGPDQEAVSAFLDRSITAANAKRRGEVGGRAQKHVGPIYTACIESIWYRKHHLEHGGKVADLYRLGFIDIDELVKAWEENREPKLVVPIYPGTAPVR
ncbi:hypothetical protein [Bradyrhizobium sp.]|jgi:hypothetical protein|uniref:hypothetical protein n=1 Tax=Bradyrhizobium sp. TaxID=376 RepID=UPI002D714C04|nr:hypothetical protein [Bradyrhizobium sp.]HZR75669.1 hypothetical protein [Bradyrhizobium sp.]